MSVTTSNPKLHDPLILTSLPGFVLMQLSNSGSLPQHLVNSFKPTQVLLLRNYVIVLIFFQDNKATKVVYLEEHFNSTCLTSFSKLNDYCNRLKTLVVRLANDIVATLIQKTKTFPSFNKACSQLLLEEKRQTNQSTHTLQALVTKKSSDNSTDTASQNNLMVVAGDATEVLNEVITAVNEEEEGDAGAPIISYLTIIRGLFHSISHINGLL
ncbi:hypothetical protein LXL04_019542 [Taraxacum kok-saghyz]